MTEPIAKLQKFLNDKEANEMFVTGPAGTGKTYLLKSFVDYCIEHKISYHISAFTNKACDVINQETSAKAKDATTLHKLLKLVPGINDKATTVKQIDKTMGLAEASLYDIVFVDEFSFIDETIYQHLVAKLLEKNVKICYLGDDKQLNPIKGGMAVSPYGNYHIVLEKNMRQLNNPELQSLLERARKAITTLKPVKEPHAAHFQRGTNLCHKYVELTMFDKEYEKPSASLLAYTREKVESLNKEIAGKDQPAIGDWLYNSSKKVRCKLEAIDDKAFSDNYYVSCTNGASVYRPGPDLIKAIPELKVYYVRDKPDSAYKILAIFGTSTYSKVLERLKQNAVKHKDKHWDILKRFKYMVSCVDFAYATTIHTAQGSTVKYALVATEDIKRCKNKEEALRLYYVALSRATDIIYIDSV
jgi:ATP-dependent exoDNAse (exonuclease V) alpha subunit